jgi:superfamily I DNA and RNA helicase
MSHFMKKYVLLTSLLLAGCATSPQDCDLHAQDPSFITKLSCTTSGGYRQKVDEQEHQVLQSERNNKIAQQDLVDTQKREQDSSQKLTDEQARLTAAQSDLAQTLKKLQSSKASNEQRLQEITKLQALQRQSQQASSASEITAIEKKIAEAKKRVAVLEQANTLQ